MMISDLAPPFDRESYCPSACIGKCLLAPTGRAHSKRPLQEARHA